MLVLGLVRWIVQLTGCFLDLYCLCRDLLRLLFLFLDREIFLRHLLVLNHRR